MQANKENIGKYGRVIDSVVAGFTGKIGKIVDVWENKDGSGYTLKFPTVISPHNIDTLYPHHGFVEIIDKVYTMEDAEKITHDINVLSLPKRVYCDSEETLKLIARRFAECHIGTSINWKELFIQT